MLQKSQQHNLRASPRQALGRFAPTKAGAPMISTRGRAPRLRFTVSSALPVAKHPWGEGRILLASVRAADVGKGRLSVRETGQQERECEARLENQGASVLGFFQPPPPSFRGGGLSGAERRRACLKLQFCEARIEAALGDEALVRTFLDQPSIVENQNP